MLLYTIYVARNCSGAIEAQNNVWPVQVFLGLPTRATQCAGMRPTWSMTLAWTASLASFDGSDIESGSYCNVEDHDTDLHVNVCRTSALSGDFPGRQLVTGLRVETEG